MVRRVGFGDGNKPNERDAQLRRQYHKVDKNHSARAHPTETLPPPPKQPPKRPRRPARPLSGARLIKLLFFGFFILPFLGPFLIGTFKKISQGEFGGISSIVAIIITFVVIPGIFKSIRKPRE